MKLQAQYCLVVEDAPNGITAATRAGMHALGLTTSFNAHTLMTVGAHWVAADLAHALAELFSLMTTL